VSETSARSLPTAFDDRPNVMRVVLAFGIPLVFGVISGLVLAPVVIAYLVLQIIAALGGIFAGIEHRRVSQAAIRGLTAGLTFGVGILAGHYVLGGTDHNILPQQPLILPWITGIFGMLFALPLSLLRRRLDR
jgi:hypothetical protein